ncbi:N-Acetyl-D-glucosamine ABC transport system, permease protein [Brachybacterium faecium]|nr:N-Acetyl-D-glucosamine ABC transport system, permease protein [Brachybacterium faecium]
MVRARRLRSAGARVAGLIRALGLRAALTGGGRGCGLRRGAHGLERNRAAGRGSAEGPTGRPTAGTSADAGFFARRRAPRPAGRCDAHASARPPISLGGDFPDGSARGGDGVNSRRPLLGWLLVGPSLIGVAAFMILPVVLAFVVSLFRWDLLGTRRFIGLENYQTLITGGALGNSLLVTGIFTLISVPVSLAIGLLLATQLVRALPGSAIVRVLVVIPWVCAPLALGVVWKWIFQPSVGALNQILGVRIEWLTDPSLALPAVAFVAIWQNVGYISLFFQAGLTRIPDSIYEAARIDGAAPWQSMLYMTIPLLRPTTFFLAVTQVVASFQVFDMVFALTGGGPQHRTEVIASLIYNEAFVASRLGRASAVAVILFLLLVVITLIQQRWFSKRITYDMS